MRKAAVNNVPTNAASSIRSVRASYAINKLKIKRGSIMRKVKVFCFLLITIFFLHPKVYSQEIEFVPHTITTSADGAKSVYAVDVDDDGDMDVLSASNYGGKIVWYENDGDENFCNHTITTSADGANSVYAVDVDDDGDIDVLSASYFDDKIAWYENDGEENFTTHIITTNADGAKSVYSADVDSDGDIDVLSASWLDDKIAWYENNGEESFTDHTITTSANGANSVFAVDLDSDGDIDVLSASWLDDNIVWYENDGDENFTYQNIPTSANGAKSIYAVDVDDDGDIDVLSASMGVPPYFYGGINWYENDGDENFNDHTIMTSEDGANSVYAVDLDSDGDMDVLSASGGSDDNITWYENNGYENFSTHTITTNVESAHSVYVADVDSDGDIDVLSASYYDDKIAWYENLQITGIINDNIITSNLIDLNNYPNPFNPTTTIEFSIQNNSKVELSIYNIKGQKVKQLVSGIRQLPEGQHSVVWDGKDCNNDSVASGIYFYKLKAGEYSKTRKMLLLR